MEKTYKLYLNQDAPDSNGVYLSDFAGHGRGHIETGIHVVSNSTGGLGNMGGNIECKIASVFSILTTRGTKVFTGTDGYRMTFQNKIGPNSLSCIESFLEFILQNSISDIEGDEYEGIDGKKSYVVTYKDKDGNQKGATMTNVSDVWGGTTEPLPEGGLLV